MGVELNGGLIRDIRRKVLHMTQEELAGLSERVEDGAWSFSDRSLRSAEAGKPVSAEMFVCLAKVLRVDPADQLLAEKRLTLDQVRRTREKASGDEEKVGRKLSAAEGIGRVRLDLQQRRQLRLFILESVTPESGIKLTGSGICFHGDQVKVWTQNTFEGFLSAALHYLRRSIRPADSEEKWGGETHAAINSALMGRHVLRVWGTGTEQEMELPSSVADHALCIDMWQGSDLLPSGSFSELMHRSCPACEPNSFYHGWRELCLWMTSNAVADGTRAEAEERRIPLFFYMEPVLQMMATYWPSPRIVESGKRV